MRATFTLLSLVIVLGIVGLLVRHQLRASGLGSRVGAAASAPPSGYVPGATAASQPVVQQYQDAVNQAASQRASQAEAADAR